MMWVIVLEVVNDNTDMYPRCFIALQSLPKSAQSFDSKVFISVFGKSLDFSTLKFD